MNDTNTTDTSTDTSTDTGATEMAWDGSPLQLFTEQNPYEDGGTAAESSDAPVAAAGPQTYEIKVGNNPDGTPIIRKMTHDEVLRAAGEREALSRKASEIKQEREQLQKLAAAMRDPSKVLDVLRALGNDPEKLIDSEVERRIRESLEDPKDREVRTMRERLEAYQAREKAEREALEQQQTAQAVAVFQQHLTAKIDEVLLAAKLPNNQNNRAEVARYINTLYLQTNPDGTRKYEQPLRQIPLEKLVDYMKSGRINGLKAMIDGADEDSLLDILPQDVVDRITKAASKRLLKNNGKAIDNTINNPSTTTPKKELSVKEAEQLNKKRIAMAQEAWVRATGKG